MAAMKEISQFFLCITFLEPEKHITNPRWAIPYLNEVNIKLTLTCVLMALFQISYRRTSNLLQNFLVTSEDSLAMFIVIPKFFQLLLYGVIYLLISILLISNSNLNLRMPILRGLLFIGHMKVARDKHFWLWQITCSSIAGCSVQNGPHSCWTLLSLASYFFLLLRSPSDDMTESSKKSKFPLIIKYLLLLLP